MPTQKYLNKVISHKANNILIDNVDNKSNIETPSTLEKATFQNQILF